MILGGDSQLGRAISKHLAFEGIDFISLNRAQLDVTNRKAIERCFASESPDVVLNTAAWTNVDSAEMNEDEAFQINALGPKYLAEACSMSGSKLIQISTDYVFSGMATFPWSEASELSPVSAYGRTKASGEQFVSMLYPNNTFIVRTAWLYSPWGKNFVKTILRIALNEKREVEVVSDQVGQPTSALDLSKQICDLIDSDAHPGIFHGTNSGEVSWFELARRIFQLSGADEGRVIPVDSSAFLGTAKRPAYSVLGHNHWLKEGLQPMRHWDAALAESLPFIALALERGE